jgi:hypothetical protein
VISPSGREKSPAASDENPAIHWIGRVFSYLRRAKSPGTAIAFRFVGRVVVERLNP